MRMMILRRRRFYSASKFVRSLYTSNPRRIEDEGDWAYSSEWWGHDGSDEGQTVFRSISDKGNGVVSVVAYPSSRPNESQWSKTENWLHQRYAELHPADKQNGFFRILGYQWRTLRFNDDTRQSTAKVMTAYRESNPGSLFLRQEPHCLAVPYLKSMISVGLTSISCKYDLEGSVYGRNAMKILCIGHGGGSLPLFLAYNIPGAIIHIVEIDPLVISASIQAMGFPAYSLVKRCGQLAHSEPSLTEEVLWKGIHERLLLYESDAEQFITESTDVYDLVFVDAYDGDDIFPQKLWDPDSSFLKSLGERLHPEHGTVVVNLHSDADMVDKPIPSALPMGKYVSQVCKAYKKVLLEGDGSTCGLAFTASVPWVCNTSLVVSRGFRNNKLQLDKGIYLNALISKSLEVDNILNLPFSCLQYVVRGLIFVD